MVPSWLTAVPIAHRGLHDRFRPENSLAAFEAAAAAGYAMEMDVQCAADGVPMVFHDDTLDRLTGARGPVAARHSSELRSLTLSGSDQTIPTLADVVARIGGHAPLLVEIKAPGYRVGRLEAAVAEILKRPGLACAVQSFSPLSVNWFRRFAPTLLRGQISMDWRMDDDGRPDKLLLSQMVFNRISRPDFIAYDIRALPNPATDRARALGLPILTWTVATPAERQRAARHADNIIFEGFRP